MEWAASARRGRCEAAERIADATDTAETTKQSPAAHCREARGGMREEPPLRPANQTADAAGRSPGAALCEEEHGDGRTIRALSRGGAASSDEGAEAQLAWWYRSRASHRRKQTLFAGDFNLVAVALVALGLCQGLSRGVHAQTPNDADFETQNGAVGTEPAPCGEAGGQSAYCSRCESTTALWLDKMADPSWITFDQVFQKADTPPDMLPKDGQPITFVRGQKFENNQYHYFEFVVAGGDGLIADDVRRDAVYLSLVSPSSIRVSTGQVVVVSEDAAKKPAYDFYVGQNCVPQEGAWNNQGYGNVNADEKIKSIYVNVTRDARYFIALQSRKLRYGVAAFDYTMKLSRGSLVSKYPSTRCTPLVYRYPDEIARMTNEFRQTGVIGDMPGGAIPYCGATPAEKKYNIRYIYPMPAPGLTQRQIAIVVGAVGGGVVLFALLAGMQLWVRYKRTTQRMAKFSSLSRGLPDALLDGEGQEVAV